MPPVVVVLLASEASRGVKASRFWWTALARLRYQGKRQPPGRVPIGHMPTAGHDAGSILLTSQVPIDRWHDIIGNPTLADAILDRIIHNAYRIELAGESMRKRRMLEPSA
jgi:hypothetical protein